jgi:membrane-bound lytic murein transglycosylase D
MSRAGAASQRASPAPAARLALLSLTLFAVAGCASLGEPSDTHDHPGKARDATTAAGTAGTAGGRAPATARHTAPKSAAARPGQQPAADARPGTAAGFEDEVPDEDFDDLLARLRAGFALPAVDHPEVQAHIDWYAAHPGYLHRVLDQGRPYLPHVADEIEARGMPAELAFLPVIESGYNPFAQSASRAVGLWQIIPGTGQRLGLKQSAWYDGRRDVVESTRAALDYLEYLHALFDGDWLLAVAAYNAGEGTIGRAVRNNETAGKPTDFWHLRLPAETRAFVPRLLGLTTVLGDPDIHAMELPAIPNGPAFATVELDGQIELALAAELAGIELAELQALNPGLSRWATDPEGPHRLQLPVDAAEPFAEAVAAMPPESLVRWYHHEVRPGDTLGALARRYGTTVAALQAANNLSGTNIRVGAQLKVPNSTPGSGSPALSAASRPDQGPTGGETTRAQSTPTPAPQVRRVDYIVRSGDSLYRIARNHSVSVDDIRRWNSLDIQRHLQPGQRLILHVESGG